MIPIGYMYKTVASTPDWLDVNNVVDIYSASGCVVKYFADYINEWKHNGFWFFNSPTDMQAIAHGRNIDLSATTLFYYEAYEKQWDVELQEWLPYEADSAFTTCVDVPSAKALQGFDVVTFSLQNLPECSPLSCNSLAKTIPVNSHCLLNTFEEAVQSLESGAFDNSEAGPFRIFAVYSVGSY